MKEENIQNIAVFLDDKVNIRYALITRDKNIFYYHIYSESGIELAHARLVLTFHKRFYLSHIYTYSKYRGTGLALILSELIDYSLKEYDGYLIRGVKMPYEKKNDISNISRKNLVKSVDAFYEKAGYNSVRFDDYIKNMDLYPELDIYYDFLLNEEIPETIVFKKIKNNISNRFVDIDNLLVSIDVFSILDSNEVDMLNHNLKLFSLGK